VISRANKPNFLGTINDKLNLRIQFIFSVDSLIEEITQYMTLEPGDVVSTGTPAGVGPLSDGDTVEVTVEGVGTLRNDVIIP